MNIQYKTHDVVLADDVRALVEEKLQAIEKLLAHHDTANISCEVVLAHDTKHQSGAVYRTDLTVFAGGERTHAVGHGETLQAAIDMAKDELQGRLRHAKGKHATLLRKGSQVIKKMMRWG
jgi:ribosomal subunit interface protein